MKIGTYNAQELTNERKERLCKNRHFTSTVKTFVEEKKGLQWLVQGVSISTYERIRAN